MSDSEAFADPSVLASLLSPDSVRSAPAAASLVQVSLLRVLPHPELQPVG